MIRALFATMTLSPAGTMALAQADRDAKLDAIFARWSGTTTPGCAVAISRNGRPIAVRAHGMANLEQAVPATPDSIYEAGSDSKQFVAASPMSIADSANCCIGANHPPKLDDA